MYKTANLKSLELYFNPISVDKDQWISLSSPYTTKFLKDNHTVLEDGMSDAFNELLYNMLETTVNSEYKAFFTDSFKVLTRNFDKTLKIIQYLLERNSIFGTFNYYLSNGYISVRKDLLKPYHKRSELLYKFKKMNGISKRHKNFLKQKISELTTKTNL